MARLGRPSLGIRQHHAGAFGKLRPVTSESPARDPRPFPRLRAIGFWFFLRYNETRSWLGFLVLGPVRSRRTFHFSGSAYRYHAARYNDTWANERTVELPIVLDVVKRCSACEILELGNVLNHYVAFEHDVVDKYERAPSVINEDILEFFPSKRYDLIVSISTLEHIGFDEDVCDPQKPARAVAHLRELLKSGGRLVITFPLGYNPDLDEQLASGSLGFDEVFYLTRVSRANRWRQILDTEIGAARYGEPFPKGNVLVVATAHGRARFGVSQSRTS
jgi:SAM-dependent methyltransferase